VLTALVVAGSLSRYIGHALGWYDEIASITLNLAIGQQTPPVASVLMATCVIAKADVWEVTRENVKFIAVLLAVLLLCTYVPIVPMGQLELFYGK
jgi:TRAP-type C4-dicarboxylate transport system permease large subunit